MAQRLDDIVGGVDVVLVFGDFVIVAVNWKLRVDMSHPLLYLTGPEPLVLLLLLLGSLSKTGCGLVSIRRQSHRLRALGWEESTGLRSLVLQVHSVNRG